MMFREILSSKELGLRGVLVKASEDEAVVLHVVGRLEVVDGPLVGGNDVVHENCCLLARLPWMYMRSWI